MDEMQYLGNMFDKIPEPERQNIREYYIGKNDSEVGLVISNDGTWIKGLSE